MNEDAYEKRYRRVHEAIALNKPDRVPLVPTLGNVFALGYGVPIQDAMTDQRSVISALEKLLTDLDPDYLYNPDFFPKEALDLLQPVNINYAGKDELKTLNGIGDVTAEKIIEYRKSNRFKKKEDIKAVKGIGDAIYEKIKDSITC